MLTILVAFSLILHVLSFAAIRALQAKIQNQPQQTDELEKYDAMFASYLEQIKAENERLISLQQQSKSESAPQKESAASDKQDNPTIAEETEAFAPPDAQMEDQVSFSAESEIYRLFQSGKTANEIAKELNMGKTEVELILYMQNKGK